MKKTLFLAILAGAALAGCVKNEEVAMSSGSSPERIKFDAPVVSVPTRATEIVGNKQTGKYFPASRDFAVYAYKTESNVPATPTEAPDGVMYMENVICTHQTGSKEPDEYWAPAVGNYYWPKTGVLSFGAYSPSGLSHTVPEVSAEGTKPAVEWDVVNGFTFNNFKVKDNADVQYDLLYSAPAYNQTKDNQVNSEADEMYDGVQIMFKHALSSIVFMAKKESDVETVTLTKIVVKNVYDTGDFDQNYVVAGSNGTAVWTPDFAKAPVDYVVYNDATGLVLKTDEVYVFNDKEDLDVAEDGTRHSDLIVMPQVLSASGRGDGKSDATVEITYKIEYKNADDKKQTETPTAEFKLAVKDNNDSDGDPQYVWEIGKRYTYHISIGLQKIYFNPQVENWNDLDGELVVK